MLRIGTAIRSPSPIAIRIRTKGRRWRLESRAVATISGLDRAAAQREQAARPALDEDDDRDQHEDLAQHRAGVRLEELVDQAEQERADQGAPQIADPAEHH